VAQLTDRPPTPSVAAESAPETRHLKSVAVASMVGTAIEFYDFFLYGLAASLVLNSQFFPKISPLAGTLASLGTFGAGILARPLGALIFGHLGDRSGRRHVLVLTLVTAGGSTALVGLLPNYQQIGIAAPVLLLALRILQGLGIGGEWGGAVLMAAEHAPGTRRTVWACFPQMGNPVGLIVAILVLFLFNGVLSAPQFQNWGWRIPFLLSLALVVLGLVIRWRIRETPEFEQVRGARDLLKLPMATLAKNYTRSFVLGTLYSTASPAIGLLIYVYAVAIGHELLHIPTARMLDLAAAAGVGVLVAIWVSANLAEKIGRKIVSILGFVLMMAWAIPFVLLFRTGFIPPMLVGFVMFGVAVGMVNGPQAAVLAELFPVAARYTGVSVAFQLASVLGGAVAPLALVALLGTTHELLVIGLWALVLAAMSTVAFLLLPPSATGVYQQNPHSSRKRTEMGLVPSRFPAARDDATPPRPTLSTSQHGGTDRGSDDRYP
jgi:MFS family permease